MPHLPNAGVVHIAFRRDVTSVRAYVRMSRSEPGSSLPASLGAIYCHTFWARKLKLDMILT